MTHPTSEDAPLIAAAKAGDLDAFDGLVRRHGRACARLAQRLTGSREDAEDVVQEAFAKAFRFLERFREDASFRTWMLRITLHQAKDVLRRRCRRDQMATMTTLKDPEVESTHAGPTRTAEARDEVARLRLALDELPARQRAALLLKVYEGLPYNEVAEALGTTVAAARVYLSLARQSLRRRFETDGPSGEPRS